MYYVLKLIQAAGLTLVMLGFLKNLPKIMDMKMFGLGIGIFAFGWILQKTMLKR